MQLETKIIETDLARWALSSSEKEKDKVVEKIQKVFQEQQDYLDLSFLQLASVPKCLGELSQLQVLLLNGNRLTSLPEELGRLTQLQVLALDYNHELKDLPKTLAQIPTLQNITTGGTGISSHTLHGIIDQNRASAAQKKLS